MTTIRGYLQRLIGGMVLAIGVACAMGSYVLLSWLADDEVKQNAQAMARQAELELDRLLLPPTTLLNLLSHVPDLKTGRLDDWIVRLPAQGSLLRANAMLESVYVGGPHGEYLNLREIKNLTLVAGTLTDEERYKVNEHMVLTIKMLESLPFPRHLRAVPEIAGNHHERIDGQGYPRALKSSELSVPARMMAIADVFEALTATDRPYKTGKTLSQALEIMADMVSNGHLDGNLFSLFSTSDVLLRYAKTFLEAWQYEGFEPPMAAQSAVTTQGTDSQAVAAGVNGAQFPRKVGVDS